MLESIFRIDLYVSDVEKAKVVVAYCRNSPTDVMIRKDGQHGL